MVDLEAEAGLITVQMYDALRWLVELLIRIRADAITARKLDILLINERGQARYNSMSQRISQFEDWEAHEWDDDYVGGIEHLNNWEGDRQAPLILPP